MALFMRDFQLQLDDAAAILGNIGHECAGFTAMQEIKPTVPSSRGGFGWAMFTGPRRRKFEAYCKRNGFNPASDQANFGYMWSELKGPERAAIGKLVAAKGLAAKVKAFELAYERAGAKHYPSRNQWAAVALDAWHEAGGSPTLPAWAFPAAEKPASAQEPVPAAPEPAPATKPAPLAPPEVVEKPVVADPGELHKPVTKTKTFWTWLLTILGAPLAAFGGLDFRVQLVIIGLIVAFGIYGIARRAQLAQAVRDLCSSIEG
ncbi:phage tail tip lysozyme [Mesorhizobium jarvisii]|nr:MULTISPECIES: phage tail tip lysozyme [Mesorhizobium]